MVLQYTVFPVCVFSIKNTVILEYVFQSLMYYGILCKPIYTTKKTSSVQIQGIANVKKFMDLIENNSCSFYGLKYIDFIYFTFLYEIIKNNKHNTADGRKQIIDIKYHVHSLTMPHFSWNKQDAYNFYGNILKSGTSLAREIWEIIHNFPVNSCLFTAQNYIQIAHEKYSRFHDTMVQQIRKNSFRINENFVTGVFQGDASVSVYIPVRKNSI